MQAMQATVQRVLPTRIGVAILIVSILANLALGAVALGQSGHLPLVGTRPARHAAPLAYYQPRMGEGRTTFALPSAASRVAASTNPYLGEGRGNAALLRQHSTLKAYAVLGQGEGWLAYGKPAELRATSTSKIDDFARCALADDVEFTHVSALDLCPTP
jgi:hypothetical protein